MPTLPSKLISDTLNFSIKALRPVVEGLKVVANTSRHQLLLPDSDKGLQEPLFAYTYFLTENTLSGHNRTIKQLLADYKNEWGFLFDAVRGSDKTLEPLIKNARAAQKAAHARLVDILDSGNGNGRAEYDALTAALTALSEQMGENAEAAAKRSRKGCKHNTYKIHVTVASKIIEVPAITLYRILDRGDNLLETALMSDSPDLLIAWGKDYKRTHKSTRAAKHEANAMNHPIPLSSVGKIPKRKVGLA